ncbi:MAG: CDP-alcohol phosphatidyltransferase family protein [Firmicutes bacterium]|nr:CDP-alcohol phosphatidyltransferase family protein [Bacillota bacterium]
MIGVYDYTVILTYLSMISGVTGIIVSVTGIGHPEIGIFFLMVSGLLDAFDGRVARTKKNRSEFEKKFGVQIDSLSDLICFGVLPAAIGLALLRVSGRFTEIVSKKDYEGSYAVLVLLLVIAVFYVLAALIRLAYFNATCEERDAEAAKTGITYFVGLPVTSAALIFPLVLIAQLFCKKDLTVIYFIIMLVVAIAFVLNIRVRKPDKKALTVIMIVAFTEFAACIAAFNKVM